MLGSKDTGQSIIILLYYVTRLLRLRDSLGRLEADGGAAEGVLCEH